MLEKTHRPRAQIGRSRVETRFAPGDTDRLVHVLGGEVLGDKGANLDLG